MGIVEILVLVAVLVYLLGDDTPQRSYPAAGRADN
jgi:hypothetical protein